MSSNDGNDAARTSLLAKNQVKPSLPEVPKEASPGKRLRPKLSPHGVATESANGAETQIPFQPDFSVDGEENSIKGNIDNDRKAPIQQQASESMAGANPAESTDRPSKRMKPGDDDTTRASTPSPTPAVKTPEMAIEKNTGSSTAAAAYQAVAPPKPTEDRAPVAHVTRNESSGSVSSDISSASSSNNYAAAAEGSQNEEEDDPAMFSPVPKAFIQDVPPAPPSTPASSVSPSWNFAAGGPQPHTPLPIATVQNAQLLEQQQMLYEGAVTPAPQREAATAESDPHRMPNAPLPGEFDDWAVGDRYEMIRILGRGSYGEVAQALDLNAGRKDAFVAIKRIQSPFDQEVDAVRLYREMHILRHMRGHTCIIQLLDMIQPPTDDLDDFHDLYLVFEYVDTDLYKLVMSPQFLTTQHIQTFLYQMLVGLKYIHSCSVIHRDLKPANILLNEDCSLKICDFGLARIVDSSQMFQNHSEDSGNDKKRNIPFMDKPQLGLKRQLTRHVVTRWYRAPELILIQPYTSAVDIWSLGCILGELLSMQAGNTENYEDRKPLFPGGACFPLSGDGELRGDEKLDQLSVIFGVIGTPSDADTSAIGKANEYIKSLGTIKPKPLDTIFPAADPAVLDLLQQMLQFNPQRRCTAAQALEHRFFNGVRNEQLERDAAAGLVGPEFLDKKEVDLQVVKQKTYEEVLWYSDKGDRDKKSPATNGTNR
eukprot:CAMPEP_0172452766 /NCGR_PEP_ID=MMETSP1065-20121228/10323_1 /TAXON_ID=265537 /ORGANISM="Amphiprora paludosa, Strain CCMP125" /LENGTH=708 /DNA_ID=CAMNT_0013204873 /DNA_START=243 /DNA_END=2369 /DNA_ORIENTATION=+